ncbi:MAG: hypothetical protein JXA64_09750, partial [Candidatus Fermentibacteraceae bacterium]|nr:hypothetical protein [Candidatus Fermentibacteraceae bacterium]
MFGAVVLTAALVTVLSCSSPTEDPVVPPFQYFSPVDSAWKVLKNLEYSYVSLDLDHYLDCFRDDLEFIFVQEGDTVSWGDQPPCFPPLSKIASGRFHVCILHGSRPLG